MLKFNLVVRVYPPQPKAYLNTSNVKVQQTKKDLREQLEEAFKYI